MDLKTGRPISIELKTEIFQNEEKTEYFYQLPGQFVRMGDTLYIRYKEQDPETNAETSVTFKIEPEGAIHLIRSGAQRSRLNFLYQTRQETPYQTPYGVLPIATFTDHLHVSLKDQPFSGLIKIDYQLYSGEEKLGNYHLQLKFTV